MQANSYSSPADTGGNREDIRNVLTILEPEDTPFTSMCKKGPAPKSTFVEVLADTLRKARTTGTREGADANRGGNKAAKRQRFGTYIHRAMDEFAVSDVQQIISTNGGTAAVSDEYGNAKAKCVREVKRDIEAINCGSQEHQGGDDTEMRTRGAMTWLSSSAQSSNPVPSDFRTLSTAILSAVGTTVPLFTEKQLNTMLKALKGVYGGKRTYQLIAGDSVVETVDNFSRIQESTTNSRYQVTEMSDKHEITLSVQVFDSSFGRVEVIPSQFVNVDSNGDGSLESALLLNMALWEMDLFDPLHSMDLPKLGGGESGYVKQMHALLCLNPKGNGKIYNT
jgi:hypothetical protein